MGSIGFRKALGCALGLLLPLFAVAQSYYHGDTTIIQPPSAVAPRGYSHTDYLIHNPSSNSGINPNWAAPSGFSPSQIDGAYTIPSGGGGEAIAIVDPYDLPSALSDFNAFSNEYSLPTESSSNPTAGTNSVFQVIYAGGSQPGSGVSNGWAGEEALDIEWAHAMAPKAKIYLVEAPSNSNSDLYAAAETAATLANVKEVSMSWGNDEYSQETIFDGNWVATGVAFFAASGDQATQQYPAESPNVVAVGGTSLTLNGSAYAGETGWSGSGGGSSAYESAPGFQSPYLPFGETNRGNPDCAAVADPNTGVAVYSSTAFTNGSWQIMGGTSAACAIVAGITNTRDNSFSSFGQSSQDEEGRIYNHLMSPFYRDITSGATVNAGCSVGWDYVTGVGTPNGLLSPWSGGRGNVSGNGQAIAAAQAPLLRWSSSTGTSNSYGVAIGADNTVYAVTGNDHLEAFDGGTGQLGWITTMSSPPNASPAIAADGTVYVGTSSALYAYNGQTGALEWSQAVQVFGGVTVDTYGDVFVCSLFNVDAYLANGTLKWTYTGANPIIGSLAIGPDGTLYGVDASGNLIAIDSTTGIKKWEYSPSAFAPTNGSPIVTPGGTVVYVTGAGVTAIEAASGALDWFDSGIFTAVLSVSSDDTVIVTSNTSVSALAGQTGDSMWTQSISTLGGNEAAIDSNNTVFIGSSGGSISGCNVDTGVVVWSETSGSGTIGTTAVGPNGIVYGTSSGGALYAFGNSALAALNVPTNIAGGGTPNGSVTLSIPASSAGATVTLQSNSDNLMVPNGVSMTAGQSTATFTLTASPVTVAETDRITATAGAASLQKTVTLEPGISQFQISPAGVYGGYDSTGTITLAGGAQFNGETIDLSSDTTGVNVPASVSISSLNTTASFYIQTPDVASPETATITATLDGQTVQQTLTVNPYGLTNFYVNPTSVVGSYRSNGVIQLAGPAGAFENVSMQSNNSAVTVPATVLMPYKNTGVSFQIETSTVGTTQTATLTATLNGTSLQTTLTVTPYGVANFYTSPTSVVGRNASNGVVQLGGAAGSGGVTVSLQSDNAAATVPGTVTVPQGSTGVSFQVTTSAVATQQVATLTATVNGNSMQTTLIVNPAPLANFYTSPSAVTGSKSTSGVVQLGGPAAPGGDVVSLSSGSADVTVPSTVTVPAGSTGVSFPIATAVVSSSETVTLTAILGPSSKQCSMTLNPFGLSNFYPSSSTITGGQSFRLVVQLSGPAGPAGNRVSITSGNSCITVPSNVVVPAGSTGVSFAATSSSVGSPQTVQLTATINGGSLNASVQVNP